MIITSKSEREIPFIPTLLDEDLKNSSLAEEKESRLNKVGKA